VTGPPRRRLGDLVRPGTVVALGDGIGSPRAVTAELSEAARSAGAVRLLLGWTPVADPGLDLTAFADVRTVMSGWGLRRPVDAGLVRALPVRLSAVPALLHGPLRPDLLVAAVVPRPGGGFGFGSEVSWLRAAVAAGVTVAGVLAPRYPCSDAGPALPEDRLVIVGSTSDRPATLTFSAPEPEHRAIAGHVAALVPEGARVQVGPGALGVAIVDALASPVRVESGLLPDGVVDLDRRGLLIGEPAAAYLAGGERLLDWADGRPLLHAIEYTHDSGRLSSGEAFIAVNTALEVDEQGQVNVEGLPGAAVGGIGGHPDYAAAGSRSVGGLSIVALPAARQGRPALVERLSGPVTTPGHDVDILVTERGALDLRGLDRAERAAAISDLWSRAG
jgi:acyl CoA:acetate/3-ketoacid CoA transferase beta subunit